MLLLRKHVRGSVCSSGCSAAAGVAIRLLLISLPLTPRAQIPLPPSTHRRQIHLCFIVRESRLVSHSARAATLRKILISFVLSRPSSLLQPTVMRTGHRVYGCRVAHCDREHEHVHVRNCASVHLNGARSTKEDARNHWMERWRLDSCARYLSR